VNRDILLWSPVIVSSLSTPRTCQQVRHYGIDTIFKRIDDIKIKTTKLRAERQGKLLEARVQMDIVVLVEDFSGHIRLFSRPELIRERIAWQEFDKPPQQETDINYIIQIQDLKYDGEMQGNEIIISYFLSYMLFAVREQVVKLYADEELMNDNLEQVNNSPEAEAEIEMIRNHNGVLNHKLYLYEKDLMSLQRGIKKAEERNAELCRELSGTQATVQQLREAVTRKDLIICSYENHLPMGLPKNTPPTAMTQAEFTLGQRIKRMFMNSL
jgi:hypothetical protein